ncbi:MAG: CoA transferase [Bacteroidia bacterium]|jgi:crotonobetainyl-CoA:carnitine CoA-transferase CaiB-like acyl-CoA transferase|nr:CoA transferase [Bacteroidia bacterium]
MNTTSLLAGVKVVELATVLAGPAVGRFFAELGAEVVKIENPHTGGDVTRSWKLPSEPPAPSISAYYASVNQGKKVVFADLGSPEGQQTLHQLLADADVLLVNFKPGDDIKFGVSHAQLAARYPRLIYGHITGYGNQNPRTAFDLVLQAETGFMSMNGTPESGPLKMPVALIDLLAAHQLKEGILVALLQRAQHNRGSYVHVSLFDAAVASLANQAGNWLMAGHNPGLQGSLHPNIAPYGETFRCSDERYMVIAAGNDRQYAGLCQAAGLPHLATDPRFATNSQRVANRTALTAYFIPFFARQSAGEILPLLEQNQVPAAIIHTVAEVLEREESTHLIDNQNIENNPARAVKTVAFDLTIT